MKGYIIKAKDKDRFYRGSVRGNYRSCGFHVKIYKSIKNALKALQYVKKHDKNFNYSIYEVEVTIKSELSEVEEC